MHLDHKCKTRTRFRSFRVEIYAVKRVQRTINVRTKRFSISRNQVLGNAKSLTGESFEDIFQTNPILPNEHKVVALRNYSFVFFTTYNIFFDYERGKSN